MSRAKPVFIGLGLIAVLGLGYLLFAPDQSQREDRRLNASVIGVDGLAKWLPDQGVRVVRSNPRLTPRAANLSLRVMPLYDVDLFSNLTPPETKDAEMLQSTQRDLEWWVLGTKLYDLRSLVVLPKWRTGFIKSQVAHETTLIPMPEMALVMTNLYLGNAALLRLNNTITTARVAMNGAPARRVALFQAQLFRRDAIPAVCSELLGLPEGALLIDCAANGTGELAHAYFLSDPDLLNNHGLSLAENASFAVDMISALRQIDAPGETRAIYLDTSTDLLLITDDDYAEAQNYERGETEFARFFEYPLSVLWAVAGVILALAGWRGLRRFGPAVAPVTDTLEQSKITGIDAKARLLRISGNDGRMVGEFVRARLDNLAEAAFGVGSAPQTAAPDAVHERLFKLLARRDAALSAQFRSVSNDLMTRGATLPSRDLYRLLETFRDLLERLTHGPDPISKPD